MIQVEIRHVSYPIAGSFRISRGAKTSAEVVAVTLRDGDAVGRGECVPYPRYGESVDSVRAQIESISDALAQGMDRAALQSALTAGAARNAVDCALWDLEAKRSGTPVWQLAGLTEAPTSCVTAYTLSLDTPEAMAANATRNCDRPLFKLKLTGEGDLERVAAVREAVPTARLIVDANEGWSLDMVEPFSAELAKLGVTMIEQPLPAAEDSVLGDVPHPVDLCADESAHARDGLPKLIGRYDMINIKLDKTGGFTEALALKAAAREAGMKIMVGCMLGSSLAMAPAFLVAQGADVVDLDGPLLLAEDCEPGFEFDGSIMMPPKPELWG